MPSLGKEIEDCRKHAEGCARKARLASDDVARADFLRLQKSWLDLAHSYEFAEQFIAYSQTIKGNRDRRG